MNNQVLECRDFADALFTSADHLKLNHEVLDNLNVFPVPDGDTGANMAGTFVPAVKKLKNREISSCVEIGEILVPRMDNYSRGNSGFIISRFFKGFFSTLSHDTPLTVSQLHEGFSKGYYEVHTALFNPIEGTMISIISSMAEAISRWGNTCVYECLENAVEEARKTLFKTPAMLPILARAGVVDSGALGFICIIEGILLGLRQKNPFLEVEKEYRFSPNPGVEIPEDTSEPGQYCTEITMKLNHEFPEKTIREYLVLMGNSIALVNEDNFLKLHIHTDYPEQVVNKFEQFGDIINKKIDDIYAQIKATSGSGADFQGCEVLACVPGEGFEKIFRELGVDNLVTYREQLPSTSDILKVVNEVSGQDLVFLPNDKNILPACMAVKEKSDKNISILPTGNIIQGLTAFYGFSENENLDTNITSMNECLGMSDSFFIHKSNAVRIFGEVEIKENDFFVLYNKDIFCVNNDFLLVIRDTLGKIDLSDKANISLFYKDDTYKELLAVLEDELHREYPHLEIELLFGGQHRSDLIVAVE